MRITPKTENEIASDGLFPPGNYDFEIVKAEDAISKSSGNEMIAILLKVYDEQGRSKLVNDYLMEKVAFKLRHAAEACGLLRQYERGDLPGDAFHGKTGRVKLGIQKDKTGQFPDKNTVADYIVSGMSDPASPVARRVPVAAALDDEIPF